MIKKYKWTLILSSLIILLPIFFGIVLWDKLPDVMATHWGVSNEPNGFSSKTMAVFGIPLCMLAMQWFLVLMVELDIKKKNHGPQMLKLMLWTIPVMTVLVNAVTYFYALGIKLNVGLFVLMFVGILFMVIGNYLPKCRQNWTMGVRTRWTLSDPENWNATHRFAGPLWMLGGFIVILASFFSSHAAVVIGIVAVFLVMALLPVLYSYLYYKKHHTED